MGRRRKSDQERMCDKFEIAPCGCWNWTGGKLKQGYGMVGQYGRNSQLAHRVSYQLHVGPIPEGSMVLHRCDNPGCVNPDHLFLGDHQSNMDDMAIKGRGRVPQTKRRVYLTEEQRAEIIAGLGRGEKVMSLAHRFDVDRKTIRNVRAHHAPGD